MDTEFARFRTMYEYENGMVMSPSGKYAGGFYATLDEDGSLFYHAVVTEVEDGQEIRNSARTRCRCSNSDTRTQ